MSAAAGNPFIGESYGSFFAGENLRFGLRGRTHCFLSGEPPQRSERSTLAEPLATGGGRSWSVGGVVSKAPTARRSSSSFRGGREKTGVVGLAEFDAERALPALPSESPSPKNCDGEKVIESPPVGTCRARGGDIGAHASSETVVSAALQSSDSGGNECVRGVL